VGLDWADPDEAEYQAMLDRKFTSYLPLPVIA
jgi:hypothetical protein